MSSKMKLAALLLGTTFFVSPALAQNEVTGDTGVSAINNGTVDATITLPNAASISGTGTVSAFIGATAAGASGQAGINQSITNSTSALDLRTVAPNAVNIATTVSGNNTAEVNSHVNINGNGDATAAGIGAVITDGVSNSIASQAVGASANAGITSRIDNVTANNVAPAVNSTNVVTVTQNVTATNTGAVTSNPTAATDRINNNAQIIDGLANSIIASASGAAASASITQSVSNSVTGNAMGLANLPGNDVNVDNVTGSNDAVIVSNQRIIGDATITGAGVRNTIGGQAIGASASGSITSQFSNVTTSAGLPTANTVDVGGNITATNSVTTASGVTSNVSIGEATRGTTVSITGGVGNSISSSAIGSSALASITQTASFGGAASGTTHLNSLPTNTVTFAGNVSSTNNAGAPVAANLTVLGVANSPATSITGGVANSISAQGIGASAGATISQHINNVRNP
jgi:hypothetical protein